MCADQAPWVADPTLAYGFAAAMIKGGNETSWCCACYELLFSSGSAIGKKMIVQVTDSVFDASTRGSQFVLSVGVASRESLQTLHADENVLGRSQVLISILA